jgi:Na+/proline symporter
MVEGVAILTANTGWWLLAAFSLVWISLGVIWGRKTRTLAGHMLADRNVGLALGSATAVATWVTSNTTMLAPQFALQMGVWGMVAYSTASIGLFLFAPMARRIRQLMPEGYTSAEFVRLRYGRATWLLFLLISLFYAFTWLVSMGIAGGLLLQSLSGIPYLWGMTVILAVCTVYTVVGGLKAVIGTDFIQSMIILLGIVVVAVAALQSVPLGEVYGQLRSYRPALLDAFLPTALMAVFNNLLFGLGEIFHSNVWWSRAFAMRDGVGAKAYTIGGLVWLPIPVTAGFIALAAPALDINVPQVNMVAPIVAGELLGRAGAIVVFVVVFSSIASSIDSLLAATADLITKEVAGGLIWRKASDAELKRMSPWVICALALAAWLVCRTENEDLGTVLFRAGPMIGSVIWPIIAGLYSRRAPARGAIAAMIAGSLIGLWAYYALGWYTAALIGTAVSMVVMIVSSRLAPAQFEWVSLHQRGADSPAFGAAGETR